VVRNGTLPTTPVDGELVILDLANNNYVGLDEVGTMLWTLLEAPMSVDEVCTRLSAHYRGNPAEIRAEAVEFLQELVDQRLVRVVEC
jgi:hypothetical protein